MTVGSLCTMRSVWRSRRAVSLHVALIVFVPGCVALTWWQVSRALGGNTLSWVYTFEWPIFGVYATFMWWKLVHDDPVAGPDGPAVTASADSSALGSDGKAAAREGGAETGSEAEPDEELAAYNRYLADLNASGRQKRW